MRGSPRYMDGYAGACLPKYAGMTLREARARFCTENRLSSDGGEDAGWWSIRFPNFTIQLPNFAWRRRALLRHDLHHIVTGYPCSPMGEMQMAAWEFAAGRLPNRLATAFCLPLVGMGAVLAPRATLAAFLRGRASTTLYGAVLTDDVLATDVGALAARLTPAVPTTLSPSDLAVYCWIVCQSLALILAPCIVGFLLLAVARVTG